MDNQPTNDLTAPSEQNESNGIPTKLVTTPQSKLTMNDLILHLMHLEAKDVTLKWVFDHVRNYVICGVALWAGIKAFNIPNETLVDAITHRIGGCVLLATSLILFSLNMFHGVVGFSKIRDLNSLNKCFYIAGALLVFTAANILFITAKSS